MKSMSIKNKVSMWYTLAMVAITFFSIFILVMLGNTMIQANQVSDLENFMRDLAVNPVVENGKVSFNTSYSSNFNAIMVVVYDKDHKVLSGGLPSNFPNNMEMPLNSSVTVKNDETQEEWFAYETSAELMRTTYYLRGITAAGMLINNEYTYASISTALIILPMIILIAIMGGSLITDSAFSHFAKLSDMANNIKDGKDLSRRIEVKNENDEVGMLAVSFNSLFDRLQKAFEREKQFTDDASHELRTPITVILSECEYAKDVTDPEEMRESIEVIHKQAKKMSSLVNQLLTMSRTDNLKKALHPDVFNYSELMEIVLEELEIQAGQRNIRLINYIDKNLYVYGDQSTLTRMVINLVSNAIKYGTEGGWVKVSITRKGNDILGMVSDNGIGIDRENIPKIFDRFYQVNPARTEDGGSMGLGLSMVKWITDAHKGTIEVESKKGEGTVFKFTLPICVEPPAENAEDDPENDMGNSTEV